STAPAGHMMGGASAATPAEKDRAVSRAADLNQKAPTLRYSGTPVFSIQRLRHEQSLSAGGKTTGGGASNQGAAGLSTPVAKPSPAAPSLTLATLNAPSRRASGAVRSQEPATGSGDVPVTTQSIEPVMPHVFKGDVRDLPQVPTRERIDIQLQEPISTKQP